MKKEKQTAINPAWLTLHSAVSLFWIGLVLLLPVRLPLAVGLLACWQLAAFGWLYGRHRGFRSADLFTALRILFLILVSGLTWLASIGPGLAAGLLLLGSITDWIDGRVARRTGSTTYGAELDAETDASVMLGISALIWAANGGGVELGWLLLAGAYKYLFHFLHKLTGPVRHAPHAFQLFSKTACAVSTLLLILAVSRWQNTEIIAAAGALALLTLSFGWEGLLTLRRRA